MIKKISVPGSKSYTNRALIAASLAQGISTLKNVLLSDDTLYLVSALRNLGIKIEQKGTNFKVYGQGGKFQKPPKPLFLGNAGTAVRFLTALLTLTHFESKITGDRRMQKRPIEDLLSALRQLRADVCAEKNNGCPPVIIKGQGLKGGRTQISGEKSSQYLSALLLISPLAQKAVEIKIKGPATSQPYLDMTLELMADFGIKKIKTIRGKTGYRSFKIPQEQKYRPRIYHVPADASSASYFFGLAALTPNKITVTNLSYSSPQGDLKILDYLKKMGCKITSKRDCSYHPLPGITVEGPTQLKPLGQIDLNDLPDATLTLAVIAAFARGKTIIRKVENLRIKETDRIKALVRELNKIGCPAQELKDGLIIPGNPRNLHEASIDTYNDHRIAMSFALAGCRIPGIKIKKPKCVSKSYPDFWNDLKKLAPFAKNLSF